MSSEGANSHKKLISYVFPVYNEAETIPVLYQEMSKVLAQAEEKYRTEVVLINDGSKDNSLAKLIELQKQDKRLKVVNFARNFGHQIAITAGLDFAEGDAVIIMDSDLQDPPAVSLELIQKWEEGYEVVYAQRRSRQDTFFKKLSAHMFYRVLDSLADIRIPKDTGDFRLVDKKVVAEIRKYREKNRFMRGLFANIGFKQTAVAFDRGERYAGTTNYPFKKMLKLALDGITSFSLTPLKLVSQAGALLTGLAGLAILFTLVTALFFPAAAPHGNFLLGSVIALLLGMQTIGLGIMGEYIGRTYSEVQNRPLYTVAEVYAD